MNIQFAINSPGYLAFEKMGQLKENVAQGQGCLLGNFLDAHLVVYNFFPSLHRIYPMLLPSWTGFTLGFCLS